MFGFNLKKIGGKKPGQTFSFLEEEGVVDRDLSRSDFVFPPPPTPATDGEFEISSSSLSEDILLPPFPPMEWKEKELLCFDQRKDLIFLPGIVDIILMASR